MPTLGLGPGDIVELVFAALLILLGPRTAFRIPAFPQRMGWCMLLCGAIPIVLRVALFPWYPMPTPAVADDFSYLLLSDTLAHFRLANAVHPMHRFFETLFVLQEPSYASPYPLGQGIVLAFGQLLGNPWFGVALSVGLFSALCYWMLRAWTTPGWALAGGLIAALQFGAINQWMNSFWGGAVSACAGCLVFGSLPRANEKRYSLILGVGLALQMISRQYEFIFLVLSVALYFLLMKIRPLPIPVLAPVLIAAALTLAQNHQITGSWTQLPNAHSREQYGVPATFTFQANPTPHRPLTREQQLDWQVQSAVHGDGPETSARYFKRLWDRVPFYRFFLIAPMYLALLAFIAALRERRYEWVAATLALFALGANFYPYFYSHYIAAVTCLFLLASLTGLQQLARWKPGAVQLVAALCFVHFIFWYAVHVGDTDFQAALRRSETGDAINQGDPEGRIAIHQELAASPGKHLVFVRYFRTHGFEEWVYNAADIDNARIVWARDLGPEENAALRAYYPDRKAWLLEPDFRRPRLLPY